MVFGIKYVFVQSRPFGIICGEKSMPAGKSTPTPLVTNKSCGLTFELGEILSYIASASAQ
jgi:hypothetical protein